MGAVGYTSGDPRKLNRSGYALGEVVAADGTGTLVPVPAGDDTEVLTADATEPTGVDWEPGGSGGGGTPSNTVVSETSFGQAASAGNVAAYSRGNHTHGTPAAPTAASVGADPAGSAADALADAMAYTDSEIAGIDFPVDSVNGETGTVVLSAADVGADASGTAAAAVAAHDADTTNVHGIVNTASLVVTTDPRLSDARTPTAHATTHNDGGSDEVTLAISQTTGLQTALDGKQPLDSDLTAIAALTPTNDDVLQRKSGAWTNRSIAQLLVDLNIARQTQTWSRDGEAATSTGAMRWYNRTGKTLTIHAAWVAAGTAPTGADLIVDVNKNGTTIFSTQANRPTIAAGTNGGVSDTPDVTTLADGDYLTVDIDQVGSTIAGSDVTVGVLLS